MTFRKIKDDSDSVLSWFLLGVSLMFMQLNPLSQSADDIETGKLGFPPGKVFWKSVGGKGKVSDQEVPWLPPRQIALW